MVIGFENAEDFGPVVGWELYRVTLDKYHVMFYFQNGWQLLNVAHSFSHKSADGSVDYTFEIYGTHKRLELDRLLRRIVVRVVVAARDRLALVFDNGDELIIHDDPKFRSWWFMAVPDRMFPDKPQWQGLSDLEES